MNSNNYIVYIEYCIVIYRLLISLDANFAIFKHTKFVLCFTNISAFTGYFYSCVAGRPEYYHNELHGR